MFTLICSQRGWSNVIQSFSCEASARRALATSSRYALVGASFFLVAGHLEHAHSRIA